MTIAVFQDTLAPDGATAEDALLRSEMFSYCTMHPSAPPPPPHHMKMPLGIFPHIWARCRQRMCPLTNSTAYYCCYSALHQNTGISCLAFCAYITLTLFSLSLGLLGPILASSYMRLFHCPGLDYFQTSFCPPVVPALELNWTEPSPASAFEKNLYRLLSV